MCASMCMLFSAIFHIFVTVSFQVFQRLRRYGANGSHTEDDSRGPLLGVSHSVITVCVPDRLDHATITFLVGGSNVPVIYYGKVAADLIWSIAMRSVVITLLSLCSPVRARVAPHCIPVRLAGTVRSGVRAHHLRRPIGLSSAGLEEHGVLRARCSGGCT